MIAPDRLGSPAALARAAVRLALPRRPDERPGISRRAKAAALAAHLGGRSEIHIRHVAVPVALVDGTAAYTVVGELLGTNRWLQVERIEQRHLRPGHGLEGLARRLGKFTAEYLLTRPEVWRGLAGVALVEPVGDLLAVRGRAFEEGHGLAADDDSTILGPVAAGSQNLWQGLPDVVASLILTGRLPRILEAYLWTPVGAVPGPRPVALPGGVIWDPGLEHRTNSRFPTLAAALTEIGLRSKDGALQGLDPPAQRRLGGSVKVARNAISYGAAVEYNPGRRTHPMWGWIGVVGTTTEEPGELVDPPVGMLATSGCRLLLALLERLVRDSGGQIAFMDTDAAAIVATPEGGDLIAVPGGQRRDTEGRACVSAVSFPEVVSILDRFRPLALATGLSLPAWRIRRTNDGFGMKRTTASRGDLLSLFKVTPECLEDGLWVQTEAVAVSTKRYVLFRRDVADRPVSVKPSGHVLATLANLRPGGIVDWAQVGQAWTLGLATLGIGPPPDRLSLDPAAPVLQPLTPSAPRDFLALGAARFTVDRPDGFRPFETLLVPVPVGRSRGRIVAPFEPDPSRWLRLDYVDAKGLRWSAGPIRSVKAGIASLRTGPGRRSLVTQDLASWLLSYFSRPEPGALGPDGTPCKSDTRGILRTRPVRVVRVHVAGAEPHRRRDEEAVLGWDVRLAQEVPGRSRICVGCGGALEGRARTWCVQCRASGGRRARAKRPRPGEMVRPCGCSCGEGVLGRRLYVNEAHRHRAKRARKRVRMAEA